MLSSDDVRYQNPDRVKPDLASVFEYYGGELPAYRKDSGLKVRCPFHGETNASAVYNEDRQTFHCFVCDASGDSWSLVMHQEGADFPEAMKIAVEHGWLDVADDGVTLEGGVESAQPQGSGRRKRGRKVRKLRRRKR